MMINSKRIYTYLEKGEKSGKSVVYWMSRDQRVWDNHALLAAVRYAKERGLLFAVLFCLDADYTGANRRSFQFMLEGLEEVSRILAQLNIPFTLLLENPVRGIVRYTLEQKAVALFSDFDPLRIKRQWNEELESLLDCSHYEVDAHNVVPCRIASQKEEFGAYTFRPRFERQLPEFLYDLPEHSCQLELLKSLPSSELPVIAISAQELLSQMTSLEEVTPLSVPAGERAAIAVFRSFLEERLEGYDTQRNFPEKNHTSHLSAYLHFGQISAQRIALEVMKQSADSPDRTAFLEQLLVRRELSDNYCFYQPHYDSLQGITLWARTTLDAHRRDEREYLYSLEEFEKGQTHERLWNHAQNQLIKEGRIHGYMRMYWAKKILEWSASPEEALRIAIFLNDKYALDGRDPNGYVGCQWAIGGVHDRAWAERPVFGKIRYMNENGCRRKFDVERYLLPVQMPSEENIDRTSIINNYKYPQKN